MESEKVKEIKKALEQQGNCGIMYEVNNEKRICKFIHYKDILTLINELEKEKTEHLKQFAENVLKFVKEYAFKDSKEIYTNGTILVPLFRVEYALQTGGQDYQQG